MTATGSPWHEGSKPSAYGSIVTIRLYRCFWIYPSPLPFCFALPIGLTRVDGAGKCDGTDSATGDLTIRDLRITARMEYRQLKLTQTESWQWDGPEALQRLCKGTVARRLLRMHATNDIGHAEGDLYTTAKSDGGGHGIRVQIACPRDDRDEWHQSTARGRYTRLSGVLPLWSLTLMISYKTSNWVQKIYRDTDTRCTGGITPPSTLPSTMIRVTELRKPDIQVDMAPNEAG